MEKQISHSAEFYEMWSSIYTLEAFMKSSPDRTLRSGTPLLWRSLWDDASTKITAYLCRRAVADSDGGPREPLSAERLKLQNEIQKISIFTAEAGEALWKNSAALFLVSSNVRGFLQILRTYLELERRLIVAQKGAAA